ncbi:MAG: hypothetical protein R3F14_28310 [Polyangiaceae bacterium]
MRRHHRLPGGVPALPSSTPGAALIKFSSSPSAPPAERVRRLSPDDSALATAHQSGVERVFRTADGKLLRELTLSAVYEAVAFAPDSSRVIFGSVLGDTALVGLPRGDLVHRHIEKNPFATGVPITFTWSAQSGSLSSSRAATQPS